MMTQVVEVIDAAEILSNMVPVLFPGYERLAI
jgi:hypothetical protein